MTDKIKEIIELLKTYEDNFELKERHPNRKFFDFETGTGLPGSGEDGAWELGNRSGKYSMFKRLVEQIIEIVNKEENK